MILNEGIFKMYILWVGIFLRFPYFVSDNLLKLLSDFYSQPKTQLLAAEHGLDSK